jgi:hypothetical protein
LLAFMSFHLGIELTLRLGLFTLIFVAAPVGLFPSLVWDSPRGRRFSESLAGMFARLARRTGVEPAAELASEPATPAASGFVDKLVALLPIPLLALTLLFAYLDANRLPQWEPAHRLARALELDQRWLMYSPQPPHHAGRQSVEATTRSGQRVELISGKLWPQGTEQPYANKLLDYRWGRFRLWLWLHKFELAAPYLELLVKQWNRSHPGDPVVVARYVYRGRTTLTGYRIGPERVEVKAKFPP